MIARVKESDVMIDLETVGTGPRAAIATIAAVRFGKARLIGKSFYVRVDIASCLAAGCMADKETLLWWLSKDPRAAAELFARPRLALERALAKFGHWLGAREGEPNGAVRVWGNGASFDLPILASAYAATGWSLPWKFYNERCYRTLKNLFGDVKIARAGTHHNALADAEAQARHAIKLLRKAKL